MNQQTSTRMPLSSVSSRRKRSSVRLEWRYASLLGLCIYLVGVFSGSFLCGMTMTVAVGSEEFKAGEQPSPVALFADRQQPRGAAASGADREGKRQGSSFSSAQIEDEHPSENLMFQPHELKLSAPFIVMGLMKAGTTSVYGYFQCGLDPNTSKLSHYDCKPKGMDPGKIGMACGKRMRRNLTKNHKPAFDTMDDFTLYAELDAQELSGGMTLPQWDYLEPIYAQFPNATWILNLREPGKWLDSVDRWRDLRERFVNNPFLPELPRGVGQQDSEMIQFYERQAQRIRDFVRSHPSLSLVEVPIDNPDAGSIMEEAFGIPKTCWRKRNMNNGTAVWTGI